MVQDTNGPRRRGVASFLATFGFAWLMVGLFTGTLVLVLFVRWIIGAVNGLGWGQSAENKVLLAVILAFVVASFLLTRALVRRMYRLSAGTRRVILGSLVIPGALSMYAWSNPTRMLSAVAGGEATTLTTRAGAEFIFGPYPDYERLKELKADGVDAVVSLQHPAVLVELQGIEAEKQAAQQLGLRLIQAPMLPWVSDNRASLQKIRELVRTGSGRYYVHCGLGRDRVNVVKRVIELEGSRTRNVKSQRARDLNESLTFEGRDRPFQRGRLFALQPGVWLVPRPNAHEFFGYLLQADAGHVLLVLDVADPAQRAWVDSAKVELDEYAVKYEVVPFSERDAADTARLAMLANRIRSIPGRVSVVVPATPFGGGDGEAHTGLARALMRRWGVSWAATPDPRSSARSADSSGR